jgi:hypothetical protein
MRMNGEEPMCPACFASVALIAAGVTSVGGLGMLVAKKSRDAADTRNVGLGTKPTEGEPCNARS